MNRKVLDLYADYRRGTLDRRDFLGRLAAIAGSASGAFTLLAGMEQSDAIAQNVSPDDARIETGYIQYPGATGPMCAYAAAFRAEEPLPGVVVIHENRGLNQHIEDVARRVALEQFMVIAPDALSPLGGTPEDTDEAAANMRELDTEDTVRNFVAAVKYLDTHPRCTGKVGVMGFCWGGGMTNQVAVNAPELDAAVPFYGAQPAVEDVRNIEADMLLHYAENDERINAGIPEFEKALKEAGVDYRLYMYEGAGHAFFNDSNPSRYNEQASRLAWLRTINFFNETLRD